MKPRKLTGMTVTELRAETQEELFKKLAKFVVGRSVNSVTLDMYDDSEFAIVVWA